MFKNLEPIILNLARFQIIQISEIWLTTAEKNLLQWLT